MKMVDTKSKERKKLAVVLVRGKAELEHHMIRTLQLLLLTKKNHCVVVENTPVYQGMLQKVKDYVTWGEISEETFAELIAKRGKEYKNPIYDAKKKYTYTGLEVKGKKYLPYFTLNPPRKGFARKGIKVSFTQGGALGYRGSKINDLLARMI